MAKDEKRCWPGYEPVPGKRPNEQGSCRKTARSKLTPTGKRVRSARKRQIDRWQEEHPHTRRSASQGLAAPESKSKSKAKKKRTTAAKKRRTAPKRTTKRPSSSAGRPKRTARRSGTKKRTGRRAQG